MATITEGLYDLGATGVLTTGSPSYGIFYKKCCVVAEGYLWIAKAETEFPPSKIQLYKTNDAITLDLVSEVAGASLGTCPISIGYYDGKILVYYRSAKSFYFREYTIATDTWGAEETVIANTSTKLNTHGNMWVNPSTGDVYCVGSALSGTQGAFINHKVVGGIWDVKELVVSTSTYRNSSVIHDGTYPHLGWYYSTFYKDGGFWINDLLDFSMYNLCLSFNPDDGNIWTGYYYTTPGTFVQEKIGPAWQAQESLGAVLSSAMEVAQAGDGSVYCLWYDSTNDLMKISERSSGGGAWSTSTIWTPDASNQFQSRCIGGMLPPIDDGIAFTFHTRHPITDTNGKLWLYVAGTIDLGGIPVTDPTVTGVDPAIGGVNKIIQINGVNFGANQQQSKVFFTKVGQEEFEAELYMGAWSDTQIQVFAPEVPEIGTWDVVVRVVSNE